MINYIIRRILTLFLVLIGLTIVIFTLVNVIPGDTARLIAGEYADEATVEQIRENMGFNDPYYIQYLNYVSDIVQGDLGRSYITNRPIADELKSVFPKTIQLAITTEIFSIIVGVSLGLTAAVHRGKIVDRLITMFGVAGLSIPQFWFALMLQLVFSVGLSLLPPSGYENGFDIYIILPALTLGIPSAGMMARVSRAAFLDVLNQNYMRTARSKGLKEIVVVLKHALKNAMIPILTLIGTDIGRLLTGAMIAEAIFGWPGIGKYGYDALFYKDMPALQATVLVLAVSICIINLLVDILYAWVDPRVRENMR